MRRLFANANYEFISNRRKAYVVSAAAILISIAAAAFWQVNEGSWITYGVDFTGGSSMRITVEGEGVDVSQVRQVATTAVPGATVTTFGESNAFLIRTPGTESDVATEASRALLNGLRTQFGEANVTLESEESVGAKVGSELQTRALLAILISFAATLIYLAFRFEWRFGVAAVIATLHDVVLTLGLVAILRLEVSLTTVAAVLTVLGYSLNDTIVIFDRIRENGVVPLGWAENGFREVTNSQREIRSPEDMEGLKIRVVGSPIFNDMFTALGANPTQMSWADAQPALSTGAVDGQENPMTLYTALNMHELEQNYVTLWHYVADPLIYAVNQEVWDSFTEEDQEIIRQAAIDAGAHGIEVARKGLTGDDQTLIEEVRAQGVTVTELTEEERQAFIDATHDSQGVTAFGEIWNTMNTELPVNIFDLGISVEEATQMACDVIDTYLPENAADAAGDDDAGDDAAATEESDS